MPQSDPWLDALDSVQRKPAPDPWLAALDDVQEPTDSRSTFAKAYDVAFTPPEAVTRGAASIANRIDTPSLERSPMAARVQGFLAGAVEGAANLLTPGDAVLTAIGLGPLARTIRGVRGGSQLVQGAQRAASAATVARGAERALDAESLPEAAAGAAQAALGGVGLKAQAPKPAAPPPRPAPKALPAGARFVAAPGGRVAVAGTDIPMTQAPDGSFVRGVPAEYARSEVRGLLPPGPRFVARAGGVLDADDPFLAALDEVQGVTPGDSSFVRGVPAEYGEPVIRGLLPEGRPAIITPPPPGSTPRTPPSPEDARVSSTPAAVLDREIDPTVPAREAVRVRQYASDPEAVDAPFVTPEQRRWLERMREDLETFTPERGSLVSMRDVRANDPFLNRPNIGGGAHYNPPTPGSPVAEDIRIISEQNVSQRDIASAIDDLLAGKPPTNRLHTASIDAANGYAEGREGYRGPVLPFRDEASAIPDDDGFEAFARAFDEVEPEPVGVGREPGQEGFITPMLAARTGGAVAGGLTGAASGDEDEGPLRTAARVGVGAALGAAAPSLLRRGGAQTAVRRGPSLAPAVVADAVARVPRTGRQGDPLRDPLAGFEPFLQKFSNPLVRDGVAKVIRDNGGFAQQRRGAINTRQLGQFANEVRVNVERALPKGSTLSAEGITAYARALQQATRKVNDLAAIVRTPAASDADLLAFQAAQAEQEVLAKSLAGARSEAGRALAAFNFYHSVMDTGDVNLIRQAANPLREDAARIADGIAQLPDDPMVRYRWLRDQQRTPWYSHLRSYYLSNLLSGPLTHARNILGNLSNAVFDTATLPVAAGIDAARSAMRGTPRTVRLSELPARVQGALVGVEKGFQDAIFALRHGIQRGMLERGVEAAATRGKLDLPHGEMPGGGLNPLNWPFRALNAPDAFFRATAREAELSGILFNQARNEGLSGQRLLDRVAQLRGSMAPEAVALRNQAEEYASRMVFLDRSGPKTQQLVAAIQSFPGSFFVLPFMRIASAITRQGAQFSPFGFLMQAAKQDGRAGTQAQARATAGTLAAGYLYWLASTGRMSGNGPTDPAQRAALQEQGWRPNSIRVGDRWYSYQTVSPLNVPASVIANSVEAWRERGGDPGEVSDVIAQTFGRVGNSFLDVSFLEGMSGFVEALKDPERNAARFFGRTGAGLIPGSSLLRTMQRTADPVVRQPRTFAEHLTAGVPGLGEQIEPRIGRFGQTITREGGPAQRALDVFNSATVNDDPVSQELARLGITLSLPSATTSIPGDATRPEETQVKRQRGQAVREALDRVISDPRYAGLDDERKTQVLEREIDRARSRASTTVRRKLTEARVGREYEHPRYGRVQLMGVMPNGAVRVSRILPDGTVTGRQFIARAGDLGQVEGTMARPASAPVSRADRRLRAVAGGKFMGALPGPITRAELESLIPEMSLTYEELKAEAESRGLVVQEP